MLIRSAERKHDKAAGTAVDQLSAEFGGDPDELSGVKVGPLAFDDQVQLAFEHQVDLLLMLVSVNPAPLARLEHDLIDSKSRHPQLATQRDEAIRAGRIEACSCDALLHDRILTSARAYRQGDGNWGRRSARDRSLGSFGNHHDTWGGIEQLDGSTRGLVDVDAWMRRDSIGRVRARPVAPLPCLRCGSCRRPCGHGRPVTE